MKKKIEIRTKIKFLMIFLTLTLVMTSAFSFWSSHEFVKQISDLGEVQLPGSSYMTLSDMMHDGIRANVYSAIIAAKSIDEKEKKAIKQESIEFASNIRKYITELQKLNLRPETKAAIAPAIPKIEAYVKSAEEIVDIALSGNQDKAMATRTKFNESFEELEKELGILGELIEKDASASIGRSGALQREAMIINITTLVIGMILLAFFFFVINDQQNQLKKIIHDLSNESNHIRNTADGLTCSAQNLSLSTTKQSNAFQESAEAIEEINSTVIATEQNSKKLDTNAKISLSSATNGKATIEQMLKAMTVISDSNMNMTKQIEEGNQKIGEIVNVIAGIEDKTKVINDIVFQTKLLSFNASVEAARAGEQGKGFAVVAEEVGNLAQMSGNAAKEISGMLSESIRAVESIVIENKNQVETLAYDGKAKVKQGFEIAQQCGVALEEIVQQASSMGDLISEISVAIKQQSQGISGVSSTMGLLDQTSNQNSVTAKENLDSSNKLQDQVRNLEDAVNSLRSMITTQ